MIRFWRLNERTEDNLGLACTEDGLFLGRKPLIERRDKRFVVRERGEIARLLRRAYPTEPPVDRLMPRLATIAAALNADDQCLARIAAVHLQIPDLPSEAARNGMEAEDIIIKSVDWNPALHPRAGTRPNRGWFAPTDGGSDATSPTRIAQNENRSRATDVLPRLAERRATVPPGERIDELGDFLEWLANAKPEDEKTIRAEIKRFYYDVGDTTGGNQLNAALSDVLEPGTTLQARQEILNGIAPYADSDPADIGQFRSLITGAILTTPGPAPRTPREIRDTPREILEVPKEAAPHIVDTPSKAATSAPLSPPIENPSEVWKLGWAARGKYFDEHFRDGSLHPLSRTIDNFDAAGVATSIKSADLNAATYQDFARLTSRLDKYIDKLKAYAGTNWGGDHVDPSAITGRVLRLIVPKGSVRTVQRAALDAAHIRAKSLGINLIVTDF